MTAESTFLTFTFEVHRNANDELSFVSLEFIDESDGLQMLTVNDVSEAFNHSSYPVRGFAYQGRFEIAKNCNADDPVFSALAGLGFNAAHLTSRVNKAIRELPKG